MHNDMSMKSFILLLVFCQFLLTGNLSFAQEYSSSAYERYVPLTDRAFKVKVGNLRSQVNSYEERLRKSRLRWNQLFQSQFELQKGGQAQKLNETLKPSPPDEVDKASGQILREKELSSQTTSILRNRYYFGFSIGGFIAKPTTFTYKNDTIPIEFDTGISCGLELGRKFEQWSFSFSYLYSHANLSQEAWSKWLLSTMGKMPDPFTKTGSLGFHSARIRANYILDIKPWFALDMGLGAGYCFSSLSELPADFPNQSTNAFTYSASIGARIAISDRGTLNLSWSYLGSLGGKDSFKSIDAYLAEIGASYYF